MSHIPNSAMPHAGHIEPIEEETPSRTRRARERAAEIVRDRPKTSAAAGAALIAGIAAAAAVPFLTARDRKKDSTGAAKSGSRAKTSAKKSAAGKKGAAVTNAKPAKKRAPAKRTSRAKSASSRSKSN